MKTCEDHSDSQYEIAVVYNANGEYMDGDCPICEQLLAKTGEIYELKRQIEILEDEIAKDS